MFGTSGIRGTVGSDVTADLALDVGRSLASEGYGRVVVGRDARETGSMLENALVAGLQEGGSTAVRIGVVPTPTLARAVDGLDCDAGVVVTASHNPPEDNGLKLWTPSGQAFDAAEREAVARRVEIDSYERMGWDEVGQEYTRTDATGHHELLFEALSGVPDLDSLSVVVDVGNGTGQVTPTVLADVGCSVTTLNGQRDGRFPGRPSEPTAATCGALRDHVAATDADFGIAHDGDADRMMAVDERGRFVPGDVLLALFGRAAARPGTRIAAPVNTSLAVDDALAAVDSEVVRTKVGDVHVADACTEDDVVFGGEPSGAWIWPDETMCPDGPLAACKLTELVARSGPLGDLADGVATYPIERDSVETGEKTAVVERVAETVHERYETVHDDDGVRVETDEGWFLVRASGTQPLVRITAEGRSEQATRQLFEIASELVEAHATAASV